MRHFEKTSMTSRLYTGEWSEGMVIFAGTAGGFPAGAAGVSGGVAIAIGSVKRSPQREQKFLPSGTAFPQLAHLREDIREQ